MNNLRQNIIKSSIKYKILSFASLTSDMAKRIMHSTLSHVADPNQVSLTGGYIDMVSLEHAAHGRKDILKYGILALISELKYYYGRNPEVLDIKSEKDFDMAIKNFNDKKGWEEMYGGYAWAKIAKSLKNIFILDKSLDVVEDNIKKSKNDFVRNQENDKKINILKQIILELNVFDGLAHNTNSIMEKLINFEFDENSSKYEDLDHYGYVTENKTPFYDASSNDLLDLESKAQQRTSLIETITMMIIQRISAAYSGDVIGYENFNKKNIEEIFLDKKNWLVDTSYNNIFIELLKKKNELEILDKEIKEINNKIDKSTFSKDKLIVNKVNLLRKTIDVINSTNKLIHSNKVLVRSYVDNVDIDESKEKLKEPIERSYSKEYERIMNLMDYKEIKDPVQVFKKLQPLLKEYGDNIVYKDWINKFKSRPDFYVNKDNEVEEELAIIKIRKLISSKENNTHDIKKVIDELEVNVNDYDRYDIYSLIRLFISKSNHIYGLMSQSVHKLQRLYEEMLEIARASNTYSGKYIRNIIGGYHKLKEDIRKNYINFAEDLEDNAKRLQASNTKEKAIKIAKENIKYMNEILSEINKIFLFAETI